MVDRVRALRNAVLLEEVPDVELTELSRLVKAVDLPEAHSLAVRGQPSPGLVIVESGTLEVLLDSSPICSLSPGSLFAEDALVWDGPAPATLRTAVRARVGLLERKAVSREVARMPGLRHALEVAYRRRVLTARLYSIDLFQVLTQEARNRMAERFDALDIPGGSTLATAGQPGDALIVLREGEANLLIPPAEGQDPGAPPEIATLRAGDYLGDVQVVTGQPHTATVTAPYDLKVMRLDRKNLLTAIGHLPGQLDEVKAALARRSESIL